MYEVIKDFSKQSNINAGILLNTSFNLHGFPIVRNENDALEIFLNSGLDALWLENDLLIKLG
jgi:carbamoyltransferase